MATVLEAENVKGNPRVRRIAKTLEYLSIYTLEVAYMDTPRQTETPKALRHRIT